MATRTHLGSFAGVGPHSISVPADAELIVVGVYAPFAGGSLATMVVQVDGVTVPVAAEWNGDNFGAGDIRALSSPSTGTVNIEITSGGSYRAALDVFAYSGVDSTTPYDGVQRANLSDTADDLSVTVASRANDEVLGFLYCFQHTPNRVYTGDGAELHEISGGETSDRAYAAAAPGAASVDIGWSSTDPDLYWFLAALNVRTKPEPTVVTHIIREDGTGDYTSLNSWQTAQVRDLVAANEIARAQIEGTWTTPEAGLTVEGWTTGLGNHVEIEAVGDARHSGAWSTTAYRLQGFDFGLLRLSVDHVHVWGLQLGLEPPPVGTNNFRGIDSDASGKEGLIIDGCLIRFIGPYPHADNGNSCQGIYIINDGAGIGQDVPNRISNNVIYGFFTRAEATNCVGLNTLAGSDGIPTHIYNNTVYGCATGIGGNERQEIDNNVVYNSLVGADYPSSYTAELCHNNASEDGTHPGTNGLTLIVDPFENSAGGDFRPAAGSVLIDAGLDLVLEEARDIIGVLRTNWSIGAFEEAAEAGAEPLGFGLLRILKYNDIL